MQYIHFTYVHTYIHTYIQTDRHIHTYNTYICTYINTCIHTCVRTYLCICACVCIYIYACVYLWVWFLKAALVPVQWRLTILAGNVARVRRKRMAYMLSAWVLEKKRQLGRLGSRWENNTEWQMTVQCQPAASSVCVNEHSGSIKRGELVGCLSQLYWCSLLPTPLWCLQISYIGFEPQIFRQMLHCLCCVCRWLVVAEQLVQFCYASMYSTELCMTQCSLWCNATCKAVCVLNKAVTVQVSRHYLLSSEEPLYSDRCRPTWILKPCGCCSVHTATDRTDRCAISGDV